MCSSLSKNRAQDYLIKLIDLFNVAENKLALSMEV